MGCGPGLGDRISGGGGGIWASGAWGGGGQPCLLRWSAALDLPAGPSHLPGVAPGPEHRAFQNVELPPRRVSPNSILALAGFLGLCLLVGLSDSAITQTSVHGWFVALRHPAGTPPNWVFPVAWGVSYTLMAVAAWLVWRRAGIARRAHYRALRLWGWQLLANALWTPAFFGLHQPGLALGVIVAMDALVLATLLAFRRVEALAAGLMAPYLAWGAYAAWLNAGLWWLNRG